MEKLTLTTPAVLFSAISLIMLSYTNRFLAYSAIVRDLYEKFKENPEKIILFQIRNLRKRLYLTRAMQVFAISSLLVCVLTMLLIYINADTIAIYSFGVGIVLMIISLALLIQEIIISVKALEYRLSDLEKIAESDCTDC